MPKYETEIFFPYSADKIHDMVSDIEKYPFFLPNCDHLTIKNYQKSIDSDPKNGENIDILAEMGVKFSIFSEKFDSNVQINDQNHTINVNLSSGPIKNMTNSWKFIEHQNGCMAQFYIEVEMNNFALKIALAAAFKIGVNEITEAFITRANQLYST